MIGRRKSPVSLPFRLYERIGKFKVSYGYKLPDVIWAFRLTASILDKAAAAPIRTEAIDRANVLNGMPLEGGETEALFRRYFAWQHGMPADSEDRKADSMLRENEKYKAPRILLTFGKVRPAQIKPVHIYKYLDGRAAEGALKLKTCRDIKYNKTRPDMPYVAPAELDLVNALCLRVAYLTVSRLDEMRNVIRQAITPLGMEMAVGKRKKGRAEKFKLIEWSNELRLVIDEALSLQRTTSLYVFGNSDGQPYTISGFNTNLRRLMEANGACGY